jgi:3-hydroxyisobutyrate dehydrogenase
MLPRSEDVEAVVAGAGGLAETMDEGSLVIDCSTSDPAVTRSLAERLEKCGIDLVDAPVAGGVVFAENGTLDVLMGGEEAAIARARPVVSAFSKECLVCGGPGAGHAMKLINNFVNANALITYAEALSVGARFGIGIDTMMSGLVSATTGRNHPLEKKIARQVLSRDFASGMPLALIAKDTGLARKLAETLGVEAPLMTLCHELWRRGEAEIGGTVDQTEIARLWERHAGVELVREPDQTR